MGIRGGIRELQPVARLPHRTLGIPSGLDGLGEAEFPLKMKCLELLLYLRDIKT